MGVTETMLEDRIGYPLANLDARGYEGLVEYGKEQKALASETADQMAKRLGQEKAEAGIKAEAEKKAKEAAAAKPADAFSGFVDRIRAATTPGACALIVAEGAGAKLTAGDLKALQRASQDRVFILNEQARTPPPLQTGADVPF
jgi:hypothetical protein